MSGEHKPTEAKAGSTFDGTPCATMFRQMMRQQGEGYSCLETTGVEGASACCAAIMPQMKAACRRLAFYAALALVALIGGTALLVWAWFHFGGA